MRTSVAGAAVLVAAAALTPVTTATAVGETCQGETATIVGTQGVTLTGTEGRDVVVTGGAIVVSTLGGNDLVCVTQGYGMEPIAGSTVLQPVDSSVSTGSGDDVVTMTDDVTVVHLYVALGAGRDRLEGRATSVVAGEEAPATASDTEPDTILLGLLGNGYVESEVRSGQPGAANADVVHLAGSGVVVWRGPMAPGAELVGGASRNTLVTDAPAGAVTADLAAGTLGDALRWSGFEDLDLTVAPSTTSLTVLGTAGTDDVVVRSLTPAARLDVSLGAGADVLRTTTEGAPDSAIDGGGGRDRLVAESPATLRVDLARHRAGDLAVQGFEDVEGLARSVTVRGDARANRVEVAACRVAVSGRGGADQLLTVYDYPQLLELEGCASPKTVARMDGGGGQDRLIAQRAGDDILLGGPGDDRLIGGRGHDTLLGGAGRDRVIGGTGRDTCDGERATGCERLR